MDESGFFDEKNFLMKVVLMNSNFTVRSHELQSTGHRPVLVLEWLSLLPQ